MRRLWHDIQAHRLAAALFLLFWLVALAVVAMTWQPGGMAGGAGVLLLTTPLIAGALVGWWRGMPERAHRSRDRITGGMLVGLLVAEITLVVQKGGVIEEAIGGMRGRGFQGGEVLEFCIVFGVVGAFLGAAGAALAMILDYVRHQGGGLRPHHGRS